MLAGHSQQYVRFAADYYGRDVSLSDVAAIYHHVPLTDDLVRRQNPAITLDDLAADVAEIGYPEPA